MSRFKVPNSRGFSLVELMIASFLGLVLLAGVISLFLGSKQTYRMQGQLANVQTDGRYALMFLEKAIENAGWFENLTPSISSAVDFTQSTDGGGTANDSIAVQYEGPAGTMQDCNGSLVPGSVIINQFYVNGTSLLCLGNGGAVAQPVIENVERFQVVYGVDNDKDGAINQYLRADEVTLGKYEQKVIAVQFAVLIKTETDLLGDAQAKNHEALDVVIPTNDKKLYRLFKKTVMLPNQAFVVISSQK